MQQEGERIRAVKWSLVGVGNGLSLLLLGVLVGAYGTGAPLPFESISEFIAVAPVLVTQWVTATPGTNLAQLLGILGGIVAVGTPAWFLIGRPLMSGSIGPERPDSTDETEDEDD